MNFADLLFIPTFRRKNFQSETMRETSHARLNAFQSFIIAGSAGALSRSAVNGFSVMKICSQVGLPGYKMGAFQSFVWTLRVDGLGGFSKGLIPAIIRSFPHIGIQFSVFDKLAKQFVPDVPIKQAPNIYASSAIYLCGGFAGSVAAVITHPLDLVKVRLVVQGMGKPTAYNGMADCFAKILKSDGVFGLYRGFIPSVVGAFVYSGEMFMLWDLSQRVPWMRRDAPFVPFEWFLWPAAAVAIASGVSHPIDVLRRKMMAYDPKLPRNGGSDINARGLLQTTFNVFKYNGVAGYLYGIVANMAKVGPQLAVFWLTYRSLSNVMLSMSSSPSKKQVTKAAS